MKQGLRGTLAQHTLKELLEFIQTLAWTGTLLVENESTLMLTPIHEGNAKESKSFDEPIAVSAEGLSYSFFHHDKAPLPKLESYFPQSSLPVLRALPRLGHETRLEPDLVDLVDLFAFFAHRSFTGFLSLEEEVERGLVLLHKGNIAVAYSENDGIIFEGTDALRMLRRLATTAPALYYRQLVPQIAESLLGLASLKDVHTDSLTGLESSETAYTYFHEGDPLFAVATELRGRSGQFAYEDKPAILLPPTDPLGWERQSYSLTLRGRDALNPITELSMRFKSQFGKRFEGILKSLNKDSTPESLSNQLGIGLSELRLHMDKLEKEGFIRPS